MINKFGEWQDEYCHTPAGDPLFKTVRNYVPGVLRAVATSTDSTMWFARIEGYETFTSTDYNLSYQPLHICQAECDRFAFHILRETFRIIGPELFSLEV